MSEYRMCPWGSAPVLLKHHRDHTLIKLIQVISVTLTIASAFGLLFSEKFTGHREIRGHCVDADVEPEFGTRRLDNVQVGSVNRTDAARGRLPIIKGLTRHKHVLFNLGCQSRLAGNKSNMVTYSIVSARVKPLVTQTRMSG